MATVSFTRGSGTLPSIIDGQFVVNTSTGKVYLDNNTSRIELAPPPVTSVNNKTGTVTLSYSDVGADQAGTTLPHFFITTVIEIAKNPKEAKSGWYHMTIGDATVLPTSNHGSVLIENDCGIPYQIFFPDNSFYVYKRYSSSGVWGLLV